MSALSSQKRRFRLTGLACFRNLSGLPEMGIVAPAPDQRPLRQAVIGGRCGWLSRKLVPASRQRHSRLGWCWSIFRPCWLAGPLTPCCGGTQQPMFQGHQSLEFLFSSLFDALFCTLHCFFFPCICCQGTIWEMLCIPHTVPFWTSIICVYHQSGAEEGQASSAH